MRAWEQSLLLFLNEPTIPVEDVVNQLDFAPGTVYGAMKFLVDMSYLTFEKREGGRAIYTITPEGKERAEKLLCR